MDLESRAGTNQDSISPSASVWTRLEKSELVLILCFAGLAALFSAFLPSRLSAGEAMLYASGALLFQSLVRDLSLLAAAKRAARNERTRSEQCFCLESTLGLTGILIGIGLSFSGLTSSVAMTSLLWAGSILSIGALGFFVKDYVVKWSPWAIAKDKDHLNLVVRL